MSATVATQRVVPESVHREDPANFVRWALECLQIPVEVGEQDALILLPEADREPFAGQQRLRLPLAGPGTAGQESLAADSRFMRWLTERLRKAGPAVHARPRLQPMGVNDIAGTLFGAYRVDNGQMHLAGCQMTDHAFLRLTFAGDDEDPPVRHIYVAPDGSAVDELLVARLGLDELQSATKSPPRISESALRTLAGAGRRMAAKQSTSRDPDAVACEPLATAVVWVRHAEGRLQFTIGGKSATQTFSSWARLLEPKPFLAKNSGAATFHIAATDDGRIDAAEQMAVCQHSGRRVLDQELVACSVTGKRVLPDFTERCSVSGRPTLRQEFATCSMCRQRVSKIVLNEGACTACRNLAKISKDDPRLVWILGEHPGLDRWKSWQLAESDRVYICQATALMSRLLVVVDKELLAIRRVATAGRLGSTWVDATEREQEELLR